MAPTTEDWDLDFAVTTAAREAGESKYIILEQLVMHFIRSTPAGERMVGHRSGSQGLLGPDSILCRDGRNNLGEVDLYAELRFCNRWSELHEQPQR